MAAVNGTSQSSGVGVQCTCCTALGSNGPAAETEKDGSTRQRLLGEHACRPRRSATASSQSTNSATTPISHTHPASTLASACGRRSTGSVQRKPGPKRSSPQPDADRAAAGRAARAARGARDGSRSPRRRPMTSIARSSVARATSAGRDEGRPRGARAPTRRSCASSTRARSVARRSEAAVWTSSRHLLRRGRRARRPRAPAAGPHAPARRRA